MKKTKINLSLNKQTVSELNNSQLLKIHGGQQAVTGPLSKATLCQSVNDCPPPATQHTTCFPPPTNNGC